MTLALRYAVRSDVGLLREGNEDSAYAGPHLLAVADGMGGYEAGEVASAAVISTVAPLDRDEMPESELIGALSAAVATARQTLRDIVDSDPAVGSMGTTLTAMLWSGGTAAICHIGDSRAYLLRDGELFQITRDHTFVQALVDQGRIRPEEAATHPQRSLLLRALDGRSDADPDLSLLTGQISDRYLLCSDGLSVTASDEQILQVLAAAGEPGDAVLQLIDLAIRGGGPDNITCIVADVLDTAETRLAPTRSPIVAGAASVGDIHDTIMFTRPALPVDGGMTQIGSLQAAQPGAAAQPAAGQRTIPGHARSDPGPGATSGSHGAAPDDDADDPPGRRRLPVVTSILVLILVLIAGGLFIGYRYTQTQYYVGQQNGKVVIFRGLSQPVLGISLSSVKQQTGIPLAEVPVSDLGSIRGATIAGGLSRVQQGVARIRTGFTRCQAGYAAIQRWKADKPKPVTRSVTSNGKTRSHTFTPHRRPEPPFPQGCPPMPPSPS